MLLAAGAVPSMTISPEEIAAFVAGADALLVNLGTFDAERRAAIEVALGRWGRATKARMPWVLDPVFIESSPARRAIRARSWWPASPSAVRLNRPNSRPLFGGDPAGEAASRVGRACATVVALTGGTDIVTDGPRRGEHRQRPSADGAGHRHGLRRLGAGCAPLSRSKPIAWLATIAALTALGVAGEVAAETARGPGSFAAGSSTRCTISTARLCARAQRCRDA